MRAESKKELLRQESVYKTARNIVDGFTTVEAIAGMVGFSVGLVLLARDTGPDGRNWPLIVGLAAGGMLIAVAAFLQRELLHAFFDIADANLQKSYRQSAEENPVKPQA
jgi:hypothetical protein